MDWFNATSIGQRDTLPTVARAAIAHLYFESIHPFEDGNGRIGRAISEKALAQGFSKPVLTALAETILTKRRSYYLALEKANKRMDATNWVLWFMATVIEARRRTMARVEFLIEKTRLLDSLRGELNARQEKALLRVLREGPDGFKGGLSAGKYSTITGAPASTATRDLADMVMKGALTREGQRKSTRYHPAIAVPPLEPVTIDDIDGYKQ